MAAHAHKKSILGAGEVAQRLRALSALPENLSSIPSTHMAAHNMYMIYFILIHPPYCELGVGRVSCNPGWP